ncbi:MAG: hypothetical protein AAGD13_13620 [Pseudomonadota bacterium]
MLSFFRRTRSSTARLAIARASYELQGAAFRRTGVSGQRVCFRFGALLAYVALGGFELAVGVVFDAAGQSSAIDPL